MQVVLFVTEDESGRGGTAPLLVLRDHPASALPPHPRSLNWQYFATIEAEDRLLDPDRPEVDEALRHGNAFISNRLLK